MDPKRVNYLERLFKLPTQKGPLAYSKSEAQQENLVSKVITRLHSHFDQHTVDDLIDNSTFVEIAEQLDKGRLVIEGNSGDPKKLSAYLKLASELWDYYEGLQQFDLKEKTFWTQEDILEEASDMMVAFTRIVRWTEKDFQAINELAHESLDLRKGIRAYIESTGFSKGASEQATGGGSEYFYYMGLEGVADDDLLNMIPGGDWGRILHKIKVKYKPSTETIKSSQIKSGQGIIDFNSLGNGFKLVYKEAATPDPKNDPTRFIALYKKKSK